MVRRTEIIPSRGLSHPGPSSKVVVAAQTKHNLLLPSVQQNAVSRSTGPTVLTRRLCSSRQPCYPLNVQNREIAHVSRPWREAADFSEASIWSISERTGRRARECRLP